MKKLDKKIEKYIYCKKLKNFFYHVKNIWELNWYIFFQISYKKFLKQKNLFFSLKSIYSIH